MLHCRQDGGMLQFYRLDSNKRRIYQCHTMFAWMDENTKTIHHTPCGKLYDIDNNIDVTDERLQEYDGQYVLPLIKLVRESNITLLV